MSTAGCIHGLHTAECVRLIMLHVTFGTPECMALHRLLREFACDCTLLGCCLLTCAAPEHSHDLMLCELTLSLDSAWAMHSSDV